MWKICIAAVVACLVTANAASAAELKIGIVDMREIITNSEPAKRAKATMASKFGAERDKLEKQSREVQKLAESLKSAGPNQSREALEQKRSEFIRKQQDLEQKGREYNARAEKEQAQLQNEMLDMVFKVAKDFAVKKGIAYLVDAASILYVDEALVLTKEFLEEVNRQWKENPPASAVDAPAPASSGGGKKK